MLIMYAFGHLIGWLTRNVMQPLMSWQPFQIFAVIAGAGVVVIWSVTRVLLKVLIVILAVTMAGWLIHFLTKTVRRTVRHE
jgi:Flp pilus assembly protein TadB